MIWSFFLFGCRRLTKAPLSTMIIVASLAVGIGVSTAAFSFLSKLFLFPPAKILNPDRLVSVFSETKGGPRYLPVSYTTYRALVENTRSLSEVAAAQRAWLGLGVGEHPERVLGEIVSFGYFETLGVPMAQGRSFTTDETEPASHSRVVILSHRLWKESFAASPAIVSSEVNLNGQKYRVVGVTPQGFKGIDALNSPQLWVPFSVYEEVFVDPTMFEQLNGRALAVVARLAPGQTEQTAQQEVQSVAAHLLEEHPSEYLGQNLSLVPVAEAQVYPGSRDRLRRTSLFLMLLGGILVVSACVNVANLLLIQAARRAREFAVRLSLGASRRNLITLLVVENMILAALGSAFGLLVAYWIWQALWSFRPPYFGEDALGFATDVPTIVFALSVAILTCILFGLAPIVRALQAKPSETLKKAAGQLPRRGLRAPAGAYLVTLQVCLSTVMLTGTALFLATLQDNNRIDLGFKKKSLLTLSWDFQSQAYTEERARAFRQQVLERIRGLSGVTAASLAENRPLGGFRLLREVNLWSRQGSTESAPVVGSSLVDPQYFSTLAIPLLRGRAFSEADLPTSPTVAILNAELARLLSPEDPLTLVNELLWIDDQREPVEVVGIAQTIKYIHPSEKARPALFLSSQQFYSPRSTLHVRTAGAPEVLLGVIRREMQALDPLLPLFEIGTLDQHLDRALWALRMNVVILGVFSLLALLLAAVGVYGVTAFAVEQQTREIGIRIACGAKPRKVVLQTVQQGAKWVFAGLGLGLTASYASGRWLDSLFHNLQLADLGMLVAIALLIVAIGLVANFVPALRAARIDPVEALRT